MVQLVHKGLAARAEFCQAGDNVRVVLEKSDALVLYEGQVLLKPMLHRQKPPDSRCVSEGHLEDASEVDTTRCIGGQGCRRSWGSEDLQIVGVRGGHVAPVDEVVDRPLCEERVRVKSFLPVVNAAKAKKSKRDDREGAYRLPGEALQIL